MHPARRLLPLIGLLLASLAVPGTATAARHHAAPAHHHAAPAKKAAAAPAGPPIIVDNPELLVDMQTGNVLYADNAGAPWHPASLTKLMTAYVTFQAIADGRVTLDTRVVMSRKAVNEAPARSGLPAGDSLSLKDALYVMLVKSANDMAVAIAETVGGSTDAFAAEMNATAARLGLTRTHYDNVNGLPDDGQVTTARDLAVLAIDLRRTFPQYDPIFRTQMVTIHNTNLRSSNELLSRFQGVTGMKTGYICASGLNVVATVERNGRQLLAVVLGGDSARERDQLAAQLLTRGFAGELKDSGNSVVNIANDMSSPPMDMKPLLCGAKAKAYVTARLKQYPMGLRGAPNFLVPRFAGDVYAATDLGPITGGPGTAVASTPDDSQPSQGDTNATDEDPGPPDPTAGQAPVPAARPQGR